MTAALLTLTDSRLPAGGHAHSGGVEQAITAGLVVDPASLTAFLRRRLATAGAVAAGLAAAACRAVGEDDPAGTLVRLDAEADARTPSPALRVASRQQGRGLVRVGSRAWPHAAWAELPTPPHHPLALGVAAAAGRLTGRDAAAAAAYLSITGPATAAQRLLAMNPLTVAAVTARLAADVDHAADCGADLDVMRRDSDAVRGGKPTLLISLREDPTAATVAAWVREQARAKALQTT